jgi:transcriptional regulator GlxA family with amidase domain
VRKRMTLALLAILCLLNSLSDQDMSVAQTEPAGHRERLKVAIVITGTFNLLDVAGVREVFGAARRPIEGKTWEEGGEHLFEVYLVSDTKQPLQLGEGATITAGYTFKDAPQPDIVVVGAQNGNPPELFDWLKQQNEKRTQILSVCVGAAKLAKMGLLDGHSATSHHDYLSRYDEMYPKVHWLRGRRYVRATNNIYTAGGDGIAGMDLSLHIVDMKFGRRIAQGIADYLEYHGDEWKQDDQASSAR